MADLVRKHFTNAAAAIITDEQGIDGLRPGGMIPNPIAAAAGQPAAVYATGESISMIAESNLKLASYYLRHQERIGRTVTYTGVDLATVRVLHDLKQYEKDHVDPVTEPTVGTKDWSATIEAIEEWLRGHLSVNKVPLAYVVRKEMGVPASADDPSADYKTVIDEMIAHAPIETPVPGTLVASYIEDRRKVWDLMTGLLRDKECWTYVKPQERARDGRGGFLEIWNHFLGPNNAGNMATRAERTLDNTSYVGEKRRWNFEKFVSAHKKQHTILANLQADRLHNGINGLTKVRLLNQAIKTKELDVPKSQIMASPVALCQDFDACISLYKDCIEANTKINPMFNVSEAQMTYKQGKPKDGKYAHKRGPKRRNDYDDPEEEDIEDRYYSSKEYETLTKGQKFSLKKKREGRGSKR
eukprot:scaffold110730_cov59-Attheya_sp.AAC.3